MTPLIVDVGLSVVVDGGPWDTAVPISLNTVCYKKESRTIPDIVPGTVPIDKNMLF